MPIIPATKKATKPTNKLPQALIDSARIDQVESFNARMHLNFKAAQRTYTMKEIGLGGQGISPNAVTEPFPLFTEQAVNQMRVEIFSEEVL